MTNDNKISFFCNVLTQAPHLDLAQVVAELDRFGISPKQVTLGDILGAKYRVEVFQSHANLREMKRLSTQGWKAFVDGMALKKEVEVERGWFATDDSSPSTSLKERKRLARRARTAVEALVDELGDDEVENARRVKAMKGLARPVRPKRRVQNARPSRQRDPLTDGDAKTIVFTALVAAGGDKNWVLAEKIKAFGSNVQLRRDMLAQLCRVGLVERTGRNRGTKYRVSGVKDIKPVAAPRPSGPRRDLSGRMKDVVKVDKIDGMRKPDFVKIAGAKKKPGQAKEPS